MTVFVLDKYIWVWLLLGLIVRKTSEKWGKLKKWV